MMNGSLSSPSGQDQIAKIAPGYAPTPLKGRTARRRSRKIIRTGVLALEEAKERASPRVSCPDSTDKLGKKEDVFTTFEEAEPVGENNVGIRVAWNSDCTPIKEPSTRAAAATWSSKKIRKRSSLSNKKLGPWTFKRGKNKPAPSVLEKLENIQEIAEEKTPSPCAPEEVVNAASENLQDDAKYHVSDVKSPLAKECMPLATMFEGEENLCNKSEVDVCAAASSSTGKDCRKIIRAENRSMAPLISRPKLNLSHPPSTNSRKTVSTPSQYSTAAPSSTRKDMTPLISRPKPNPSHPPSTNGRSHSSTLNQSSSSRSSEPPTSSTGKDGRKIICTESRTMTPVVSRPQSNPSHPPSTNSQSHSLTPNQSSMSRSSEPSTSSASYYSFGSRRKKRKRINSGQLLKSASDFSGESAVTKQGSPEEIEEFGGIIFGGRGGFGDASKRKKHQRFNSGHFLKSPSDFSGGVPAVTSQEPPEETEEIRVVALGGRGGCGGDASTAQDIGNYRMLIDDLSYLCSAIIHCRSKPVQQHDQRLAPAVCRHSPITAGAACDIAELISQSGVRSALLIVSAQASKSAGGGSGGAKVGALEAVLESIACAPPVSDLSGICHELIDRRSSLCRVKTSIQQKQVGGSRKVGNDLDFGLVRDGPRKGKRFLHQDENSGSIPVTKSTYVPGEALVNIEGYDAISLKALSIVSYFVGIDCTGSDRAAIPSKNRSNRLMVQLTRKSVLHHKSALQGIARLVAYDPVVHAYLIEASNTCAGGDNAGLGDILASKDPLEILSERPSESSAPLDAGELGPKNHDPTKMGRRSRKKRGAPSPRQTPSFTGGSSRQTILEQMPSQGTLHGQHLKPNGPSHPSRSLNHMKVNEKPSRFDYVSPNGGGTPSSNSTQTDLNSGGKYEEKISLALSRAKLTNPNENGIFIPGHDSSSDCTMCKIWAPQMTSYFDQNNVLCGSISASNLAIEAAESIITGKDKFDAQFDAADDTHDDDEDSLDGLMSKNPIVYANEMLRQSGSLPYYSRSMSETLVAILLSSNSTIVKSNADSNKCLKCVTYLQRRATSLSEVIDNLCCLSPNVSAALSLDELFLVPSLLRVVAELAFVAEDSDSSLLCESMTAALKTLTSLTHENPTACDQIVRSYRWKISLPTSSQVNTSGEITGLDIVFSYLVKIVSLKQEPESAHHKSKYDHTIFCLNILTNVVEMVPNQTKKLIESMIINESSQCVEPIRKIPGLTWLVRWVVSKTTGFQNSVMKGSFGSQDETNTAIDTNELKAGEEENLVISGNGFVLLACLMVDHEHVSSGSIRDSILKELPIDSDGNSGGIQFMIKTLKAFCNFYHYSVGDLSVAVIAPVVKLITGLEEINEAEQQAKWSQIYNSTLSLCNSPHISQDG
mmetsp:Transcript_25742/g.53775  ORF Transcript_25742/g.53775 Transcript_25742/m.53775 type:complete len:1389 (-) Transcript_25742:60-4226(-)